MNLLLAKTLLDFCSSNLRTVAEYAARNVVVKLYYLSFVFNKYLQLIMCDLNKISIFNKFNPKNRNFSQGWFSIAFH